MSKKLGNEPAFPAVDVADGMSKRFYAACAAMQGLLANTSDQVMYTASDKLIKYCYELADELLKQENDE